MSIPLECINIIIPIVNLRKCPSLGNIEDFFRERLYPGSGCWRDEDLFREGAMNPVDVTLRLEEWKRLGLRPTKRSAGQQVWHHLCVVDTFSGPTLACDWLECDLEKGIAWSKMS